VRKLNEKGEYPLNDIPKEGDRDGLMKYLYAKSICEFKRKDLKILLSRFTDLARPKTTSDGTTIDSGFQVDNQILLLHSENQSRSSDRKFWGSIIVSIASVIIAVTALING